MDDDYEIIPPRRNQVAQRESHSVAVSQSTFNSSDPITAFFDRLRTNRDTLGIEGHTRKSDALVRWRETETRLVEQQKTYERALCSLYEQREELVHGMLYRREERADKMRQLLHSHHINDIRRQIEVTQALIPLADAQAHLRAYRKHADLKYDIIFKRQFHEMLELDLDTEAKKALLNRGNGNGSSAELNSLYDTVQKFRDVMAHNNMDTTPLDEVLAKRKR